MIHTDYRFRIEDYKALLNCLKQPNGYRYAALLPASTIRVPKCTGVGRKKMVLPDGILILSHTLNVRSLQLQDLSTSSLTLVPFILAWEPGRFRIRLQVNRAFVKNKLKVIRGVNSPNWYGSKVKTGPAYIKYVNQITRELRYLRSLCFTFPETIHSYNKRLREYVLEHLTSVQKLNLAHAQVTVGKYLLRLT